jgi:hypothetical protein
MSTKLPRVSAGAVYAAELPGGSIGLDSVAWFKWLEREATKSFSYPLFDRRCGYITGFLTVRKERRQRGGVYWSVYRRAGGRLRKVYLGQSNAVTAAHLAEVASKWLEEGVSGEGEGV